ncbi:L-histidine N(alpha)-methyltransferase [Lacinutrix chionoecetis]
MESQFKTEVVNGLSNSPKTLPSKYFYDAKGDALFVKIMNLPEYYLTRSELEIFKTKSIDIINKLNLNRKESFDLIELGAGDGKKTKAFLKALISEQYDFKYLPIDISQNALNSLEKSLQKEFTNLTIETKQGQYFGVLNDIKSNSTPKVLMFLGSNLGNLNDNEAQEFLTKLSDALQVGDKVIIGLDTIKSKEVVLPAYNDSQGVTSAFNLNLLNRINNELNANFNVSNFEHNPEYDETTGIAKSYLVSKVDQQVMLNGDHVTFKFSKGEKILTEISRKYNDSILNALLKNTKLEQISKITDSKNYFNSYILERM